MDLPLINTLATFHFTWILFLIRAVLMVMWLNVSERTTSTFYRNSDAIAILSSYKSDQESSIVIWPFWDIFGIFGWFWNSFSWKMICLFVQLYGYFSELFLWKNIFVDIWLSFFLLFHLVSIWQFFKWILTNFLLFLTFFNQYLYFTFTFLITS
jgi:hypothetical protein